ncbi:hypothetical protein D3C80_1742080 [compost metagenome]
MDYEVVSVVVSVQTAAVSRCAVGSLPDSGGDIAKGFGSSSLNIGGCSIADQINCYISVVYEVNFPVCSAHQYCSGHIRGRKILGAIITGSFLNQEVPVGSDCSG